MLVQCWPAVYDIGLTFIQRCVAASYSLGMCINVYFSIAFIIIIIHLIIIIIIIHTYSIIVFFSKVASTIATYGFSGGLLSYTINQICKCFYFYLIK